ncbi:MAG: TolC family protein [Chitinophagaceae bacterium]|nr:TolC family protein [Chitinophagaceae bacterium]
MNLRNTIKENAFAYQASKLELQQARDNLILNVILAYLQVLNNEDVVASATRQAEVSQKQLERLQVLDRQGAVNPSQLSDVKGQLMNDQLAIINARNEVESSKLLLAQLMNIPYSRSMELERVNAEDFLTTYKSSADEVFQSALQQLALIKAVQLRRKSSEYALRAVKGELYPVVSLNGNMQTNYSSAAQNTSGKIPYSEQIRNNVFSSVNLGLRVPIFNSFQTRNRIKLADIAVRGNELLEENARLQVKQNVEQAYLNMTNALERYRTLQEQVNAYEESFKAAEVRFNAGVGTSVDYLIAKNNLDRATINLISAKYDFVLRKKVLDYYSSNQFKY